MKESINNDLDKIDLKLLRLLQDDGRKSNSELADLTHTSPATCYRRIQRLYESGYIDHTRAVIAPELVELGTLVMVGVILDRSTPESFAHFEQAIKQFDFILSCYLVAGEYDYLLKIRVKNMESFNKLHSEKLLGLPEVRQLRTYFVMKEVVENAPLPF
jgi:Lrp/AsnC family leucine-responsive transcriptional regulator